MRNEEKKIREIWVPWKYQRFSVQHLIDNTEAGLFMDMGMGKTSIVLTALYDLMYDYLDVNKVLIIAPKTVAETTWTDEAAKWQHLKGLKFSVVLGTERQRIDALKKKADIYIINVDNVAWLVAHHQGRWPYDCVVIDESSKFKNHKSERFKALKQIRPKMDRVIILSGTPVPNGMGDLWSQIFLLDRGERLEDSIGKYRAKYFQPAQVSGQTIIKYSLQHRDNVKIIMNQVKDICISMKAEDYLDVPKYMETLYKVQLTPKLKGMYDDFARKCVLDLIDEGKQITAANAGVLNMKLLQFTGGAIYDSNKDWHSLHNAKLDAMEDILDAANGQPLLVAYHFQHEKERLLKHFKSYKPVVYSGPRDMDRWNAGEYELMLGHPQSIGHGLNLQYGGHLMAFYTSYYNLENDMQFIKRIHRQGQAFPVRNRRLVMENTIDMDVLASLVNKEDTQSAAIKICKALIQQYA